MKNIIQVFLFLLLAAPLWAQQKKVSAINDQSGSRLIVNGKPFMVNGMNWDYFPIGTNYSYSLWTQSDDVIKAALDQDMPMLKNMGVNAIRLYADVPAQWVRYIYEQYGIYTMVNTTFGRYGLTINGAWVGNTDYSDPKVQKALEKPNIILFYLLWQM